MLFKGGFFAILRVKCGIIALPEHEFHPSHSTKPIPKIENDLPHGEGKYQFANGTVYEGQVL